MAAISNCCYTGEETALTEDVDEGLCDKRTLTMLILQGGPYWPGPLARQLTFLTTFA